MGEYLDALAAAAVGRPGEWARQRCRRLAGRIVRWDVQFDGRPVGVSGAAVACLPAWALPRIEAALLTGLTEADD